MKIGLAIWRTVASISASRITVAAEAGNAARASNAASARRSQPFKIPRASRIPRVRSLTADACTVPSLSCGRHVREPITGTPSMSDRQRFGPSQRSAIAPFIVMEMMAAANARAATGAEVLHLEVGEPCGGATAGAIAAATAAMARSSLRLHRGIRPAGAAAPDRPATTATPMAWRSIRITSR